MGLAGKTVGIVGLGRIGLRVAEIIKSFKVAKILYTSRTEKPEASEFNGEKVDFSILLKNSDFIIVTVALTPQTRYMFNAWAFSQMKNTAIFVNASRGDVVDQVALIDALRNNSIAAAGLDVTSPEPVPLDSELLLLDNCGAYHQCINYITLYNINYISRVIQNVSRICDGINLHLCPFSDPASYRKRYRRN